MSPLISKNTTYLIQGITGKEGQRVAGWMLSGGAHIAAGVTPGKGGQKILGIPIYNSVQEAVLAHPEIAASSIYVPPQFVKSAALEAIEARIPLIHIIAENVPTQDTVALLEKAQDAKVQILGPSSVGVVSPHSVMGSLGGGSYQTFLFPTSEHPTGVAVLSKSGGMANTMADMLTRQGISQSLIVGIGGDRIVGTTYADLLPVLEQDDATQAVIIIGEIGGTYEEDLATAITIQQFSKPVVAYISGIFAETLPKGVAFGHAGAIVDGKVGTRQSKIDALRSVGAHIASDPQDIVKQVQKVVQQ